MYSVYSNCQKKLARETILISMIAKNSSGGDTRYQKELLVGRQYLAGSQSEMELIAQDVVS
jgi:hypothetical protein